MKNLKILPFILLVILANNLFSQWISINGPTQTWALAISGSNLFAGGTVSSTNNGVFVTTNNGQSWSLTSLNNVGVGALAVYGSFIFAGTNYNGIYLSADNGQTWTQMNLYNQTVMSLAIGSTYSFAGTYNNGVYYSTNYGTWIQTSLNWNDIYSLAVSGSNVFAGTRHFPQNNGIYRSLNNGQTWTQTTLNNLEVDALLICGSNIFAGTASSGVFLSTNNGQTWSQTSLNNQSILSFVAINSNIYVGTGNGVYYTSNNGALWFTKNEGGLSNKMVYSLCISADYIFAGTNGNGVYRRSIFELLGLNNEKSKLPEEYSLFQNYPNPFNPSTTIKFDIPKKSDTKITIFNALGKEISTLISEKLQPGSYEIEWNGSNYPSGIYFYQLKTDNFSQCKKMILLK